MFLQYVPALMDLWQNASVRAAFDRRREFQLMGDSIKYYMENLERIGQTGYSPTTLDILHARKATTGITEHEYEIISDVPFNFVDVGHQLLQGSQRQRWCRCLDAVTSIVFFASSIEFDQVLFEDRRTNRLTKQCNDFGAIINNPAFVGVPIILILSDTDLLAEKIRHVSIRDYFPQFAGDPQRLEDVQQFELGLFDAQRSDQTRPLCHHFANAADTENIKFVFSAVKDAIVSRNWNSLKLE